MRRKDPFSLNEELFSHGHRRKIEQRHDAGIRMGSACVRRCTGHGQHSPSVHGSLVPGALVVLRHIIQGHHFDGFPLLQRVRGRELAGRDLDHIASLVAGHSLLCGVSDPTTHSQLRLKHTDLRPVHRHTGADGFGVVRAVVQSNVVRSDVLSRSSR